MLMIQCGIPIEAQHHEVATGGQCEIDMRFSPLVEMADKVLKYKYIVKNVAKKHGKTATFMPKPLFQDNGSACTCIHPCGRTKSTSSPAPATRGCPTWACTPSAALEACAGPVRLHHPTTNSYKRLVPGYEAPVNLAYSRRNRSGGDPHPGLLPSPKAKRIEFRCPDAPAIPTSSSRHADGHDRRHQEQDAAGRTARQGHLRSLAGGVAQCAQDAGRLGRGDELSEKDHEFLLQSDVFTDDVISTWIWYKREKEVDAIACVRIHTSFTCTTTREKAFQAPRMRYSDSWG